jgi:hypothetical protein
MRTCGDLLTIGKIYKVLNEGTIGGIPVYYLKKDTGFGDWVLRDSFITIEQAREEKLNQLGIVGSLYPVNIGLSKVIER